MLKFNSPKKFYDEKIFNIIDAMQGKNFTLTFDKNELSFFHYDTFNLTEELKGSKLIVEKDIFSSLLVFDSDKQAHFVLHYKNHLESIEAHPLKKGISFFKFKRELEKLADTQGMHELTACQINWKNEYSTFGLHQGGEIKYFMNSNYELIDGIDFREMMKEMEWDKPSTVKYVKREVFTTKEEIENWLAEHHITKYTISSDLVVDVQQPVALEGTYAKPLVFIPFQFGKVEGDFLVEKAILENLEGFPHYVKGNFDVYSSSLKSLKGGPRMVMGFYDIVENPLSTLEFCPSYVGGIFKCFDVPLKSLEFLPQFVGQDLDITNCRLKELDLSVFKDIEIGENLVVSRRIGLPFKGFENLYTDNKLVLSQAQISQILLKDKLDTELTHSPMAKKMKI